MLPYLEERFEIDCLQLPRGSPGGCPLPQFAQQCVQVTLLYQVHRTQLQEPLPRLLAHTVQQRVLRGTTLQQGTVGRLNGLDGLAVSRAVARQRRLTRALHLPTFSKNLGMCLSDGCLSISARSCSSVTFLNSASTRRSEE